jgi:hypothetical protein
MFITEIGVVAPFVSPDIEWNRTYRGMGITRADSAIQASDGGFVIAGTTEILNSSWSFSYVVKTDPNGVLQWNKTYGRVGYQNYEEAYSVSQAIDGGYVFSGYIGGVGACCLLVKTDPDGNVQWNRTYQAGGANCVRQTTDGGYVLVCWGGQAPDYVSIFLIKTDSNGNMQWNKTFPNTDGRYSYVQQTSDGGFVILGVTNSTPLHPLLLKTDSIGDILWNWTYKTELYWPAESIEQTSDEGYIFAFRSGNYPSVANLVKVNSKGTTQWIKQIRTGHVNFVHSAQQVADGGFIILGDDGRVGPWLIKTDSNGNMRWTKIVGDSFGAFSVATVFAKQTFDGGYMIAGFGFAENPNEGSFWLAKLREYPSPSSIAMYLGFALGTLLFTVSALAVADTVQRRTRSGT